MYRSSINSQIKVLFFSDTTVDYSAMNNGLTKFENLIQDKFIIYNY